MVLETRQARLLDRHVVALLAKEIVVIHFLETLRLELLGDLALVIRVLLVLKVQCAVDFVEVFPDFED